MLLLVFGPYKDLEVKKKVVPLHSHLKNGCLKRRRVLLKDWLQGNKLEKDFQNFSKKVWRFKNNAYLCNPVRKTGLGRGNDKFIEKTDYCTRSKYREKYNLSRSVNFFGNYKCQRQAKSYIKIIQ